MNDLELMVGKGTSQNTWLKAIITGIMTHADEAVRRVKLPAAHGKEYVHDIRKLCRQEGNVITA